MYNWFAEATFVEVAMMIAFAPAAVLLFNWSWAPVIVSPPVKVFAALKIMRPEAPAAFPVMLMPSFPARTAPMVALRLTELIVAWPALTSSVSGPAVPVFKIQSWLAVVASPNFKLPIVRAPSRVTVAFAVMLIVLKSARKSAALATVPPDQLAPVGQEPPPTLVQVPAAASEVCGITEASAASAAMLEVRMRAGLRVIFILGKDVWIVSRFWVIPRERWVINNSEFIFRKGNAANFLRTKQIVHPLGFCGDCNA